jgi:transcriptional regulator with XRE-family HTH domain
MKMEPEAFQKDFGSRLRQAREEVRLTQVEVAEQAGFSEKLYARMEHGHFMPTAYTVRALAMVLKVPTDELLGLPRTDALLSGRFALEVEAKPELLQVLAIVTPWPVERLKTLLRVLRVLGDMPG